jgi:hypothetical protein
VRIQKAVVPPDVKRILILAVVLMATSANARSAAAFGGEVGRFTNSSSEPTDTYTLARGIDAGKRAVALLGWEADGEQALSTISDDKGNSWTIEAQILNNTVHQMAIASAYISTPLVPGDTITITYTEGRDSDRAVTIVWFDGVARFGQPDTNYQNEDFNSEIRDSITTATPGAVIIGHLQAQLAADILGMTQITYTNSNFDLIGPSMDFGFDLEAQTTGLRHYIFWETAKDPGRYALGGLYLRDGVPHDESYSCLMVAYKPTPTYYVDFSDGSDLNDGLSTLAAWQHCPGDTNATDIAASTILGAGDTVIFRGGVVYTGQIAITQGGVSGSPIAYDGTGANWGRGQAHIDLNSEFYHAFFSNSAQDFITITGFDIYNAKNNNNAQNQTIDRADADLSGINYGGDGDLFSEAVIFNNGGSNWYLDGLSIHDAENVYDRAVPAAETADDPQPSFDVPCSKTGILFYDGADNCIVTNCSIWAIGRAAIKQIGSRHWLITDCNIGGDTTLTNKGWFGSAVVMGGTKSHGCGPGIVRKTIVHDGWQYQGDEPLQRSPAGDWFHLTGNNDGAFDHADVHDVLFDRVFCYSDHAFEFSNGARSIVIESDTYNIEWRNCLFVNSAAGLMELRDCSNIVVNASSFIEIGGQSALLLNSSNSAAGPMSITVRNNVFYSTSTNPTNAPCATSPSYAGAFPASDWNLFYNPNIEQTVWRWSDTNLTLSAWTALSNQDAHSIYGDPALSAIPSDASRSGAGDYHPSARSLLIGAALDLSSQFTNDYDGRIRLSPWTIGPLETSVQPLAIKINFADKVGEAQICWTCDLGLTYQLESRSSLQLDDSWNVEGAPITADAATLCKVRQIDSDASQFYRVRLIP